MATQTLYFDFDVSLAYVEPRIWRRFLLRADATFHDLHDTIQKACGWLDCHLYEFRSADGREWLATSPHDDPWDEDDTTPMGTEVPLGTHLDEPGNSVSYMYDFGDSWLHAVEVKGVERRPGTKRRIMTGGARSFPPEDCGSLPGYERCVEATRIDAVGLSRLDADTREELLWLRQWMGPWDPEAFDLEHAQRQMHRPVALPHWAHSPPPTPPSGGRVVAFPTQPSVTIERVFEEFLGDQEARLKPRTVRQYVSVIDLLGQYIDRYGHEGLPTAARKRYDRHAAESGREVRLCELLGPDEIPLNTGMFLNDFVSRKVMAGADFKRAAGTVTKKLLKWLEDRGYLSGADTVEVTDAVETAADAARDLPRAERAARLLGDAIGRLAFDPTEVPDDDYEDYDQFTIERLERDKVWLSRPGGDAFGPISVPPEATKLLRRDWEVSCSLARHRGRWFIAEAVHVQPR